MLVICLRRCRKKQKNPRVVGGFLGRLPVNREELLAARLATLQGGFVAIENNLAALQHFS